MLFRAFRSDCRLVNENVKLPEKGYMSGSVLVERETVEEKNAFIVRSKNVSFNSLILICDGFFATFRGVSQFHCRRFFSSRLFGVIGLITFVRLERKKLVFFVFIQFFPSF